MRLSDLKEFSSNIKKSFGTSKYMELVKKMLGKTLENWDEFAETLSKVNDVYVKIYNLSQEIDITNGNINPSKQKLEETDKRFKKLMDEHLALMGALDDKNTKAEGKKLDKLMKLYDNIVQDYIDKLNQKDKISSWNIVVDRINWYYDEIGKALEEWEGIIESIKNKRAEYITMRKDAYVNRIRTNIEEIEEAMKAVTDTLIHGFRKGKISSADNYEEGLKLAKTRTYIEKLKKTSIEQLWEKIWTDSIKEISFSIKK